MRCPFCGAIDTQVVETRLAEDGMSVRRRRRCASCDKRFTTYENADVRLPQVVKGNGMREEFSEAKLREGFRRALHKRPVSAELVNEAIAHIRQKLLTLGEREIPSRELGEMVMDALYRLDKVAYIRFASVYRSFQGVDDFRDVISSIREGKKGEA